MKALTHFHLYKIGAVLGASGEPLPPWFWVLNGLVLLCLVWWIYITKIKGSELRKKAMDDVRRHATADFQVELDNRLTRISLFTEVLEYKLNGASPEISDYIKQIRDNSLSLNASMRDFLWALDPKKNTAYELLLVMEDFGKALFENTGVVFPPVYINVAFKEYHLDMEWKWNLLAIMKEAMLNALNHSDATEVRIKAVLSKDVLNLTLTDNGLGFDQAKLYYSHGMLDMRKRAEALDASVSIESDPGKGTIITFIGAMSKSPTAKVLVEAS